MINRQLLKDNITNYSFDTSPIEHLEYPRDLRYTDIVEFKLKLANKIKSTYENSKADPNYSTFLKHFGDYKTTKFNVGNMSKEDYILEELSAIKRTLIKGDELSRNSVSSSIHKSIDLENIIRGVLSTYNLSDIPLKNLDQKEYFATQVQQVVMHKYAIKISITMILDVINQIYSISA